ncbi:MAG: DUF3822 family protein [Candidatus Cryptobacteroides sp.]|nr:DUF3822 family protein [Bacteroidales bacterium]MDD7531727.1 DUF3822 family protein [Bacteroidales bacterium]MDY2857421.1 DUF3822 family protein [Candidatus Cryptobacteroides sp.]MDY5743941.1 DUF3822 family protein [Candidatus Cryptobacteroides sp.]
MQETGSNHISVLIAKDEFTINTGCARSEWLGAGLVFSTEEFRKSWDRTELSVLTPKFSLVPDSFFDISRAREMLAETVDLDTADDVRTVAVPEFAAHALYSVNDGGQLSQVISGSLGNAELFPEQYWQLKALQSIPDYNKIIASYGSGRIYLTMAQGRSLLISNSFPAGDFTTAQYWIFSLMRNFQLNPEVSTIWFRTPLEAEWEISLYSYFKSVEFLQ